VATHWRGGELGVGVVEAGDQQGGDLDPHVGLVVQPGQGVEHRGEVGAALVHIEVVGEGLEVDVGGVHHRVEVAAGLGVDVAGGDRHGGDARAWQATAVSMAYSAKITGSL
jgi:hypothetical protein